RVDAHRLRVCILAGDALIHLEQVAVAFSNLIFTQSLDGVAEIEINAKSARADATTLIARFLRGPRCNVARRKIAETWILPFQEIVAVGLRDRVSLLPAILFPFGNPDPAIVPQGF